MTALASFDINAVGPSAPQFPQTPLFTTCRTLPLSQNGQVTKPSTGRLTVAFSVTTIFLSPPVKAGVIQQTAARPDADAQPLSGSIPR